MIDGVGMGHKAGAEFYRAFPFGFPAWALPIVARLVLAQKQRAGIGNLEPTSAFLAHFPAGYEAAWATQREQQKMSRKLF